MSLSVGASTAKPDLFFYSQGKVLMIKIAILGFGVVGSGVADLLTNNKKEVSALGGDNIEIKYILDLRDFPASPFAGKVIHDFGIIESDSEVDYVIEVMGGSHPAYEYTLAALRAGKHVITSNKEVVAKHGDEFLREAEKFGVCYRFEAAVGGGIPVIAPLISFVRQNRISEVRGILNGTTNYILNKMFSLGESFEESLRDAQQRGYAERNPDADVLGTDACRKIAILTSLVSGKLVPTEAIHTEGITAIRSEDVLAAESLGMQIKLLGRAIIRGDELQIMVAPFMIPEHLPLASVSGVYNAVEVIGEPIGNIMFYGPGAGAGATASAVVGDLVQIMQSGRSCAQPLMKKSAEGVMSFDDFEARQYIALSGVTKSKIEAEFGSVQYIESKSEVAFVTEKLAEKEIVSRLDRLRADLRSRIRLV